MSEFNSTLDLVDNEELKISDCWIKGKQSTQPISSSENGLQESELNDLDRDEELPRSRRKKLPSIVEGDFSPLGITSLKQSFFDKIREARSKSSNEWSFLITFLRVTCGPCFWAFCLVTTLIAPLLMLLIGSVLFNQCPSHPSLPPLLIIIGLITCLGNLVNIVDSFIGWKTILGFNRQNGDWTRIVIVTNIAINTCDTILTIILGFIIGFTSKPSANSVDGSHYCNPVVYKFSYWFVTLIFIYAALIIILLVVSLALVYIKTHFNTNRDSQGSR